MSDSSLPLSHINYDYSRTQILRQISKGTKEELNKGRQYD